MKPAISFTLKGAKPDAPFIDRRIDLDLDSQPVLIGRASKHRADAVPKSSNALFDCPVISRRHAEIAFDAQAGTLKLTDLGSLHGTLVNNYKTTANKPQTLQHGDVVTIGSNITLDKTAYHAIVFQFLIHTRLDHLSPTAPPPGRAQALAEVIDLSSPIGSPRPRQAGSRNSTDKQTVNAHAAQTGDQFVVPVDSSDGEHYSRSSSPHPTDRWSHSSALLEMDKEDSQSSMSDFDSDDESPDCLPISPVGEEEEEDDDDGGEYEEDEDEDELVEHDENASLRPRAAEDAPAGREFDFDETHGEHEGDVDSAKPAFTSGTPCNFSPISSLPGKDEPSRPAELQPKPTNSTFFSRILSNAESSSKPSDQHDRDRTSSSPVVASPGLPPSAATPSHSSPPWMTNTSLGPHQGTYSMPAEASSSSIDRSCSSQLPASATMAEPPREAPQAPHLSSSRPTSHYIPPPPPPPPREFGGFCDFSTPGLDFAPPFQPFPPRPSFLPNRPHDPVPSLPFSSWVPAAHAPHPFYPVHGVSEGPVAFSSWDGPAPQSMSSKPPEFEAAPVQHALPPQSLWATDVSTHQAPPQMSESPICDNEDGELHENQAKQNAGNDQASPKVDQARMAIKNIISSRNAPDKADIETVPAATTPSAISTAGIKRKAHDVMVNATGPDNEARNKQSQDPALKNINRDSLEALMASTEPPTKRARPALKQVSVNASAPPAQGSRARRVAHAAAKYTFAGVVGGAFALGGLLALPASVFQ